VVWGFSPGRRSTSEPADGQRAPGGSVRDRERLRQHRICFLLLEAAGIAYTSTYLIYGQYAFAAITFAGMLLGAVTPFAIRRGALQLSANCATAALFIVIVTTTFGSGGVSQAGYAWIFVVPLAAGLLGGMRPLLGWGALSLAATLMMAVGGIGRLQVTMSLDPSFVQIQSVFDIVLIFVTVILVMATFLRTRTLAERENAAVVAELARAEGEARQADRAKSAFLATMSHEIRTPMNGVIGMADVLLDMPLGEQQRRFAEVIRGSGESLLMILNDILDYSKLEAGHMEIEAAEVDLRRLVEQAVELIAARGQEQRLTFVVDIDPSLPPLVVGDATRLRQVLMNLLGNAVKFTAKGEVEVRVDVHQRRDDGVRLALSVRDTGIGIAPEAIGRLFRPFTQADATIARQFGGTGLGLAISARLVDLMGGRIGVESTPGAGSTFTVEIDLRCPSRQAVPVRPLMGRRLLVVDHHARRRDVLRRHLIGLGGIAVSCSSADEARMVLAESRGSSTFDGALIVRDGDGDGLTFASELAAGYAATRVVLLVEWGAFVDEATLERLHLAAQVLLPGSSEALLDALDGRRRPAPALAASEPAPAADAPLVLIVDDNLVNRRVAHHQLSRLGYRVIEAENGRDAVQQVAAATPAVVLMDIEMPVMDGWEATRSLRDAERGRGGRVPVIALTAHVAAGSRERVLAAGMDDYLTKPLRREELGATLRRLLQLAS
jgi:signal transduction histidine kinase/DNA-binding NarL/FixJ family response regulator